MKILRLLVLSCVGLSACQSADPVERKADSYEAAGRNTADVIKADSISRATALESQARSIDRAADAAGGFTEKKLDVRADALRREADIVKDQGNARADAVQADADAKAKELRAR